MKSDWLANSVCHVHFLILVTGQLHPVSQARAIIVIFLMKVGYKMKTTVFVYRTPTPAVWHSLHFVPLATATTRARKDP